MPTVVQVAGQPGTEQTVISMVEYDGKLYGLTYDSGNIYRWNEANQQWDYLNTIGETGFCMVLKDSKLWIGGGSSGKLYSFDPSNNSVSVEIAAMLNNQETIYVLTILDNTIYAGTGPGGRLFEADLQNHVWIERCSQLASQTKIRSFTIHYSLSVRKIYAGTYPDGLLFSWSPGQTDWTQEAGSLNGQTCIYSMAYNIADGCIYAGTCPGGRIFRYDETGSAWVEVANTGETGLLSIGADIKNAPNGTIEHEYLKDENDDECLFFGSFPNGKLFKILRGTETVSEVGNVKQFNQDYIYSIARFKNELMLGTKDKAMLCSCDCVSEEPLVSVAASQYENETRIVALARLSGRLFGLSGTGKILEWDMVNRSWAYLNEINEEGLSMIAYRNKLWIGGYGSGYLYSYDPVTNECTIEISQRKSDQQKIIALTYFDQKIYAGTGDGGCLFEADLDNGVWIERCPAYGDLSQICSLAVSGSKIYAGTFPEGHLLVWAPGDTTWGQEITETKNGQTKINSLAWIDPAIELFAGTYPGGRLFRWDQVNHVWEQLADVGEEDIPQILTKPTYDQHSNLRTWEQDQNGENCIFFGTSNSGKIYKYTSDGFFILVAEIRPWTGETHAHSVERFDNHLMIGTQTEGKLIQCDCVEKLPGAPRNLHATVGNEQVDLSWSAADNLETGFKVYKSENQSFWASCASLNAGETSCTITGLTNGTTYYFKVVAIPGVDYSSIIDYVPGEAPPQGNDGPYLNINFGKTLDKQDGNTITAADANWPHSIHGDSIEDEVYGIQHNSGVEEKFYNHDWFNYSKKYGHQVDSGSIKYADFRKCDDHPSGEGTGSVELLLLNNASFQADRKDGYTSFDLAFARLGKYLPWIENQIMDIEFDFKVPSNLNVKYLTFDLRYIKANKRWGYYCTIRIDVANGHIDRMNTEGTWTRIATGSGAISNDWHKFRFVTDPKDFNQEVAPEYVRIELDSNGYDLSSAQFWTKDYDPDGYGRVIKFQAGIVSDSHTLANSNGVALRLANFKLSKYSQQ